ncbi:MAG: hypothetical protein MUC97_08180 [Bernardetiaceae bacterium]|nr:hypothetical protein [Bernardetiaceae bacterium]
MEQPSWQIQYLKGFYEVVHHKYPQVKQYAPEKRVRLMALAYNVGFHLPEAKLWQWQSVKYFPYGNMAKFLGQANTHSYTDLAAQFFLQAPSHVWCE